MQLDYSPEPGEFFVALGDEYKDIIPIQAYTNNEDSGRIYGAYYDRQIARPASKPVEAFSKPFFPFFSALGNDRARLAKQYELYLEIRGIVLDFLESKNNYSSKIEDIERHLIDDHGKEEAEVKAILKGFIADTLIFSFKVLKGGDSLSYSKLKADLQNRIRYFGSLGEEIQVKSDKISLLVSHSQTVGNYREFILRDLLKKFLPSKFSIATGFIQGFSRQLDIIIYDSHNFSPSFREGELAVVQQEAVRAVIEVKTTLNTTSLTDSLEMFHEISVPGFMTSKLPIFKGVFAFETDYVNVGSIADAINDFYNKPYWKENMKDNITRDIIYLFHEISSVCVMKEHCLVSQYSKDDDSGNILPMLFSFSDRKGNDIQTAIFLSHLFSYLDVDFFAKKTSIWNFSKLANPATIVNKERNLADNDWIPRFLIGHKGDQKTIQERLDLFNEWFEGDIETADFVKSFAKPEHRVQSPSTNAAEGSTETGHV